MEDRVRWGRLLLLLLLLVLVRPRLHCPTIWREGGRGRQPFQARATQDVTIDTAVDVRLQPADRRVGRGGRRQPLQPQHTSMHVICALWGERVWGRVG